MDPGAKEEGTIYDSKENDGKGVLVYETKEWKLSTAEYMICFKMYTKTDNSCTNKEKKILA